MNLQARTLCARPEQVHRAHPRPAAGHSCWEPGSGRPRGSSRTTWTQSSSTTSASSPGSTGTHAWLAGSCMHTPSDRSPGRAEARSSIAHAVAGDRGRGAHSPAPRVGLQKTYLRALMAMMIVDESRGMAPLAPLAQRFTSAPKRHLVDRPWQLKPVEYFARLLGDIRTLECLFSRLPPGLRITPRPKATTSSSTTFRALRRPRGGPNRRAAKRGWAGFQVRLGGVLVDEAAAALTRMASTRVAHPPMALGVITATEYCYRRLDGVWVIPLGCLWALRPPSVSGDKS